MPFADLLSVERIALLTEPVDRDHVLDAVARLLSNGSPTLTSDIGNALRDREQLASTAIGHGVAIPHARSNAFSEARGAFVRLGYPVAFGSGDGPPVDLVFAMSVPEHSSQQHLQTLSEIADRFGDGDFRDAVRDARDLMQLQSVMLGLPRPTMAMLGT